MTVTHLNITDTVRFSKCVNCFLEIDLTFWKLDGLLLSLTEYYFNIALQTTSWNIPFNQNLFKLNIHITQIYTKRSDITLSRSLYHTDMSSSINTYTVLHSGQNFLYILFNMACTIFSYLCSTDKEINIFLTHTLDFLHITQSSPPSYHYNQYTIKYFERSH